MGSIGSAPGPTDSNDSVAARFERLTSPNSAARSAGVEGVDSAALSEGNEAVRLPRDSESETTASLLDRAANKFAAAALPGGQILNVRDSVEGLGQFSPPLSLENSTVDLAGPLSQLNEVSE